MRHIFKIVVVSQLVMLTACSATPEAAASASAPSATTSTPQGMRRSASSELITVDSATVNEPLRLPAQLYVEQDASIGARSSGVLRSLSVDLGSAVTTAQVIGRLDDDVQRLAVARADVALDRATKAVWRAQEMRATNNVSVAELEDAEFQLRLAEVAKRAADLEAERTTIVAPFKGVVSARFVQPGQLLAVNDTVVRVTARGPYLIRARVPESDAGAIRAGSRLAVRTANGRALSSRVLRLAPAIDAASGTREVILLIEERGATLLAGSAVVVELFRSARRVLAVPRSAVSDDGYVVVSDGSRTVMRPVLIGGEYGERVEIRSGLAMGERVRRVAR